MNYYIQGNIDKASQIKAAFEKLGIDVLDFGFADKTVVYCSIGGCVQYLPYTINLMHILYSHPDYKELELPVELKFKVGDWIVRSDGSSCIPIQVYGLKKDRYLVTNMLGSKGELMINRQDEWHLWTIEDVIDGDVLANTAGCILIVKDNESCLCYIDKNGKFHADNNKWFFANFSDNALTPATKEQRDLLFAKMKDAGYQLDVDKKELRKIKPHYDIANFKVGMPVLVRDTDEPNERWQYVHFSHYYGKSFYACGSPWDECIPFNDDTKHLLGTTDMPSEEFINW